MKKKKKSARAGGAMKGYSKMRIRKPPWFEDCPELEVSVSMMDF